MGILGYPVHSECAQLAQFSLAVEFYSLRTKKSWQSLTHKVTLWKGNTEERDAI